MIKKLFFITLIFILSNLANLEELPRKDYNEFIASTIKLACQSEIEISGNQTICSCILFRVYDAVDDETFDKHIQALHQYNLNPSNIEDREFLELLSPIYTKAGKMCYPL